MDEQHRSDLMTLQDVMNELNISKYLANALMKKVGRVNIGNGSERGRWAVSRVALQRFAAGVSASVGRKPYRSERV